MAHIVIAVSSLKGLLYASYEMASRLISEGHSITYMCPITVKEDIENEGFNFFEVPDIGFYYKPKTIKHKSWSAKLKTHLSGVGLDYETRKNELSIPNYKRALEILNPDMVLCDIQLHEIIFATYGLKIPVKLLSPWFCFRRLSGIPPIRYHVVPGKGLKGSKIGMTYFWLKVKLKVYARYIVDILTFNNYRRQTIKQYGKEVGFPVKRLILRNFPSYFIYDNLPILSMTNRDMEFPYTAPKNITYIGAMVYEKRANTGYPEADRLRLSKIIDAKKTENKKLIYYGMGSMAKGDITFIEQFFEAVKNEPDWILIISLGKNLNLEDFANIPNNVHIFNWVSQPNLLKHIDCCINHLGMNTINECVHNKVPMLSYSRGMTDQNGNAARIEYFGLGIIGSKENDDNDIIKKHIAEILNNSSYKNRVSEFNAIYETYKTKNLSSQLEIEP